MKNLEEIDLDIMLTESSIRLYRIEGNTKALRKARLELDDLKALRILVELRQSEQSIKRQLEKVQQKKKANIRKEFGYGMLVRQIYNLEYLLY